MGLGELLASINRLEDLSRVLEAIGFVPEWQELPGGVAIVARHGEFAWHAIESGEREAAPRLARRLAAGGRPAGVIGLDTRARKLVFAGADGQTLSLSTSAPNPLDLARLERCAPNSGEGALATGFRIAEALDGKGVDDRFFTGFRGTLLGMMAVFPAQVSRTDRHALALLTLTRILFLYFIEAKGWLDGRPRFLREEVDRCLARGRSLNRDLLQPLFFGTLNRPAGVRSALARQFGRIPFLNGGLFEPHPLERRWRVALPTPILREAFDRLFERFHFTLTPGGERAVAPDMLGRVFEGVMDPEERHATGSYYTPAPLVDALLADGLATWLSGRMKIGWTEARRRLDAPDPAARRILRSAKLLDPAVGSGAFLLGALRWLAGPTPRPSPEHAARLRRVLQTQLFGVDRNAAAVRLAELRLWLEVVASDPTEAPLSVPPLPNLDALIRQGDSLSDPAAGLPLPPPRVPDARLLASLRRTVVGATGVPKRTAVAQLIGAERRMAETAFQGAVGALDARIAELLESARSPSLFGERRGLTRATRAELAEFRSARRRARMQLRAITQAGEVPWFHYPVHFGDVMQSGGFDLVVGNPPWVRAEALDREQLRYLAERFRWFRGGRQMQRGYAHQADLAVVFVERALELLAPNGVLAFLVPGKLATAGYAAPAREELARRTTISVVADLRNEPRAAFDATVYPMALVTALAAPPERHRLRTGLGQADAGVRQSGLGQGPWGLVPDAVRSVVDRLGREFPAVGDHFTCHLGVKTGLNRAFLDPPPDVETHLVRWAVRGRDVGPFRIRRIQRLLWPCDGAGRPLDSLPPGAARHVETHSASLRRRADHCGGPPWAVFRTSAAAAAHRVIWADVSRRLEAATLTGSGGLDAIPLNSCYVISVPNPATAFRLAAWLNSSWCRAAAAAVANPASGGYARFNAGVVSGLPCPKAVLTDTRLLALGRRAAGGDFTQEEVDECCVDLLRLAPGERETLAGVARASGDAGR